MTTSSILSAVAPAPSPPSLPELRSMFAGSGGSVVLLSGSRDPNAKMTLILLDTYGAAFVAKVPTTAAAQAAVGNEADALQTLATMPLGHLAATLPRPVGYASHLGRTALLSTALAGTSMAVRYHGWHHTARRRHVERDFAAAAEWLTDLQTRTAGPVAPVSLAADAPAALARRFPDDPHLAAATGTLEAALHALAGCAAPRTVVHGDFWFGNLLLAGDRVTGVVDWESCAIQGDPLRDIARFAVSYALYLDRHTRPGARVRGHRGLRAQHWGAGIDHLLAGGNWFADVVANYLTLQLGRLGVAPQRWRDVVIGGLAEVAASADDPAFAAKHLQVLARIGAADDIDRRATT